MSIPLAGSSVRTAELPLAWTIGSSVPGSAMIDAGPFTVKTWVDVFHVALLPALSHVGSSHAAIRSLLPPALPMVWLFTYETVSVCPVVEALNVMAQHAWPGNVRELRNAIERATILVGSEDEIKPEHIVL